MKKVFIIIIILIFFINKFKKKYFLLINLKKMGSPVLNSWDTQDLFVEALQFKQIFNHLMPKFSEFLSEKNIEILEIISIHLFDLFSSLFHSEYLYKIWDFLIWHITANQY